MAPSLRAHVSVLKYFIFFYFFIFGPTSFQGDWLAFLEIWGPLLTIRSCSVGVVPYSDEFLKYLWGGR